MACDRSAVVDPRHVQHLYKQYMLCPVHVEQTATKQNLSAEDAGLYKQERLWWKLHTHGGDVSNVKPYASNALLKAVRAFALLHTCWLSLLTNQVACGADELVD